MSIKPHMQRYALAQSIIVELMGNPLYKRSPYWFLIWIISS